MKQKTKGQQPFWKFSEKEKGRFASSNIRMNTKAYFPLFNFSGLMSSITPEFKGDIKTGHHSFLTPPLSSEEIPHTKESRNFWVRTGKEVWSATGMGFNTLDNERRKTEQVSLDAGLLYFTVSRTNKALSLKASTTAFVPASKDTVELSLFTIENISERRNIELTVFYSLPLYGRSAENIRDHRCVTTLLNRFISHKYGAVLKPAMNFDERGHTVNELLYNILGCTENGNPPEATTCLMEEYLRNGSSLDDPSWIRQDASSKRGTADSDGLEGVGALRFRKIVLKPGQKKSYIVMAGIGYSAGDINRWIRSYGTRQKCLKALKDTKEFWQNFLSSVEFETGDIAFDNWMKWVSLQPHARKVMGCSFLPDFDYGRGGRGWRDLWQDCLSLLLTVPEEAKTLLINNFGGVRTDGTNATIIGRNPGEFLADRNNISRVFMDHGVWPFKTTSLYIEQTGDLKILLEKAPYFMDHQIFRSQKINRNWSSSQGSRLKDQAGKTYHGTILEHILVQHIASVLNVGRHNMCRLENADWNDALDMASRNGESVPFTAFYAGNLLKLAEYCRNLNEKGIKEVKVYSEFHQLLQKMASYGKMGQKKKNALLHGYMEKTFEKISGPQAAMNTLKLADLLENIGRAVQKTINRQEWIKISSGTGFYNGYYDNDAKRVDGKTKSGSMSVSLTGQVFPIMSGTADKEKIPAIISAIKKYLQKKGRRGINLNTEHKGLRMNFGRVYGFAYGTKENGASFSHMNVMLLNSLYSRGFVRPGYDILKMLFEMCTDSGASLIFPGLPEYFDLRGRGAYNYLTGSASWLVLSMLTEVFGIKGCMGDLVIEPKLVSEQFRGKNKDCTVKFHFAGKDFTVTFRNPAKKDAGKYRILSAICNSLFFQKQTSRIIIRRRDILRAEEKNMEIQIILG